MKSFKKILFPKLVFILILLFPGLTIVTVLLSKQQSSEVQVQPLSVKNEFQNQLNFALKLSGLTPLKYQYRDYLNQVEFIINQDDRSITIYLSTQKNPIWQVASLQKILKIATMKGEHIKLVDLSQKHPYVTLENN